MVGGVTGGGKGPKETRLDGWDLARVGLEEWGRAGVTVWTILVLVWVWSSWRRWALVVARAAGEGEERVEWRPCPRASKWPKDVASARGGLWRTS